MDLAAAAKSASDGGYKVILLAMSTNVEFAVRALYDEGLYGEGIVIIGSVDSYFQRTKTAFVGPERIVLDASMALAESGIDRTLQHSVETMAEWPEGEASFLTDAALSRVAYALDGLKLLAHAIDATISRSKSPLVAAELMSSLRTTGVHGLTGEVKIAQDWNNIRSRSFTIAMSRVLDANEIHKTPANIAMEHVGVVYTDRAALRVCRNGVPPAIGPSCAEGAKPVGALVAYAQSERTLHVTWDATYTYRSNATQGQRLLSGYSIVIASAGRVDVNVQVPRTQTTATFDLGQVRANNVYTVVVSALYDENKVEAKGTSCSGPSTCSGSLPCLPSPTAVSTCGCTFGELHTMGLVSNPQEWGCQRCMAGLVCRGGVAAMTFTEPGWFAVNTRVLYEKSAAHLREAIHNKKETDVNAAHITAAAGEERSSMFQCPNKKACVGNWSVEDLDTAAKNGSFQALYGQCADGYTGILCGACIDGFARGDHATCSKCTVTRDYALVIILGSVVTLVMLIVLVVVVAKRASRAPLLERLFIRAMKKATQRHGVYGAIALLFGGAKGSLRTASTGREGLSYDMFIEALRPGGSLSLNVPSERSCNRCASSSHLGVLDTEARALWDKLDEDGGKH